jgi:hypothetical protein
MLQGACVVGVQGLMSSSPVPGPMRKGGLLVKDDTDNRAVYSLILNTRPYSS